MIVHTNDEIIRVHLEFMWPVTCPFYYSYYEAIFAVMFLVLLLFILIPILFFHLFFYLVWYLGQYLLLLLLVIFIVFDLGGFSDLSLNLINFQVIILTSLVFTLSP